MPRGDWPKPSETEIALRRAAKKAERDSRRPLNFRQQTIEALEAVLADSRVVERVKADAREALKPKYMLRAASYENSKIKYHEFVSANLNTQKQMYTHYLIAWYQGEYFWRKIIFPHLAMAYEHGLEGRMPGDWKHEMLVTFYAQKVMGI